MRCSTLPQPDVSRSPRGVVRRYDVRQGKLTEEPCIVLDEWLWHVEELEARIARFDERLLSELANERNALALLQTLSSANIIGTTMLLIEIGDNMSVFGIPQTV